MNRFPYTDLKDINLDWILHNIKQLIKEWAEYQVKINNNFDSLEEAYESLQNYINTWFDNLNVQTEINNKLDDMADSGALTTAISPAVSAWLLAHLATPSTPPIDNTLTVSNAAADAAVTGNKIDHSMNWKGSVAANSSLNDLVLPGLYIIGGSDTVTDAPETVTSGYRFVLVYQGRPQAAEETSFRYQFYFNESRRTVYYRRYTSGWQAWKPIDSGMLDSTLTATDRAPQAKAVGDLLTSLQDSTLINRGPVPANTSLNDIAIEPGWRSIGATDSTITDLPDGSTSGHRVSIIYKGVPTATSTFAFQFYANAETGFMALRWGNNGAWNAWNILNQTEIINAYKDEYTSFVLRPNITGTTDLDTINKGGWYVIPASARPANSPEADYITGDTWRLIWVIQGAGADFRHMYYFCTQTQALYHRIHDGNGWRAWQQINDRKETPRRDIPMFDIAHRGYAAAAPENSLLAYRKAATHNFKWVETDIQFTSDNKPVMLHDNDITRIARNDDGTTIPGPINIWTITYEQALTYDFGIKFGSEYAGTRIATLQEALTTLRRCNLSAILHFKQSVNSPERRKIIYDMVNEYGMFDNVVFMTGDEDELKTMTTELHHARICLSCSVNHACLTSTAAFRQYVRRLQINNNEIWATYNSDIFNAGLADSITAGVGEGVIVTTRADNPEALEVTDYLKPWAAAFIKDTASGGPGMADFRPAEYLYTEETT